jgi:hypothetical protein
MGLEYTSTTRIPVFGTVAYTYEKDSTTILTATRTSWSLTDAYQEESPSFPTRPTKTFKTSHYSKLNLSILYTMGSGESSNSIELKIEESPDGKNFYRIPNESVSSGTSTLTAREFTFVGSNAAEATISIGLDIFYKFMRVSAKETGVATNFGTVYCEGELLGK